MTEQEYIIALGIDVGIKSLCLSLVGRDSSGNYEVFWIRAISLNVKYTQKYRDFDRLKLRHAIVEAFSRLNEMFKSVPTIGIESQQRIRMRGGRWRYPNKIMEDVESALYDYFAFMVTKPSSNQVILSVDARKKTPPSDFKVQTKYTKDYTQRKYRIYKYVQEMVGKSELRNLFNKHKIIKARRFDACDSIRIAMLSI
jgi:hypothetical protein